MKTNDFIKLYPNLDYIISCYFSVYAELEEFDQEVVLNKFIKEESTEWERILKEAIKECEMLLELDDFPEELIQDLSNSTSPIQTRKEWTEELLVNMKKKLDHDTYQNRFLVTK